MTLWEQIISVYPELTDDDFGRKKTIILQNDADEFGDYIAEWNYSKPIPDGLTLGKSLGGN
jgi:hypothetical protein